MRLAIYAICKNELPAVDGFINAIQPELRDRDTLTIVDTGSTDGTLERFQHHGINPHRITITPWRFDRARNVALALTPADADACWSLDLDEQPQPGWRDAIEQHWRPELTRLRYKFIWNWNPDGTPGITYYGDKLHARNDSSWHLPAHEYLRFDHRIEQHAWAHELTIHHYSDPQKPRPNLLPLLELGLREEPDNDRNQHYLARELFFNARMVEAASMFERHLANPRSTWRHERAESMMYLARTGGNETWARMWLTRAVAECPERRETWMRLAEYEHAHGRHQLAIALAYEAQKQPEDHYYLSDPRYRADAPTKYAQKIESTL